MPVCCFSEPNVHDTSRYCVVDSHRLYKKVRVLSLDIGSTRIWVSGFSAFDAVADACKEGLKVRGQGT